MTTNINLNLNQSPYFDDYDETKDFHQVLYKPAVAVQARELTQEQTILRNQLKRFGNHIFCLLYTSPSPRDRTRSRMPSSA